MEVSTKSSQKEDLHCDITIGNGSKLLTMTHHSYSLLAMS